LSYELVCRIRVVLVHRASTSILVSGCQRCLCPRGEPAGFAGSAPSREGMGTLSGFPSQRQ